MNLVARLIRITPVEAALIGRAMGKEAALSGLDAKDVIDTVLGRLFWRAQGARVRNTFSYAFGVTYCGTEELP